jgi:sirohydrochlorin cobaltochelatase
MRGPSVVLVGHGSSSDPLAARPVRAAARALRARGTFREVRVGFWKGRPHLRDAVARARAPVVLVIPWLFSEGWFWRRAIPKALGLRGRRAFAGGRLLLYARPVGTHPAMADAVLRCASAVLRGARGRPPPRRRTTLLVVGHGTPRDPRSARAVRSVAARLRRRRLWAEVRPAFLEQEPSARAALRASRTPFVVAVPFFAGDGPHSRRDLPLLMGLRRRGGRVPRNPVRARGRPSVWCARAVGTGPWMLRAVLDRARETLRAASAP